MKRLQVRNVPDELHRALKDRAAREGTTMSELVLRELPRVAHKPTPEQVFPSIARRSPVGGPPAAELIRSERDKPEHLRAHEQSRREQEARMEALVDGHDQR
jgi:plasmid stability protein